MSTAPNAATDPTAEPPTTRFFRCTASSATARSSYCCLLRRSLARHGWHHLESLNCQSPACGIRAMTELPGRPVDEIRARTGHRAIDIVGHSLGGPIARYYVRQPGGDRRARALVTPGTPHDGTAVAPPTGAHPTVRQRRSGSDLIEELRLPAPGCRTRLISFWSELDRMMRPIETARVDHPDLGTPDVRVTGTGTGHLVLPAHPAVAAAVRRNLGSAAGQMSGASTTGPLAGTHPHGHLGREHLRHGYLRRLNSVRTKCPHRAELPRYPPPVNRTNIEHSFKRRHPLPRKTVDCPIPGGSKPGEDCRRRIPPGTVAATAPLGSPHRTPEQVLLPRRERSW
ncbi:esterase/lipase family protein [Streptomyces nitrosporeus]|uniref:esterase/lipase family protein n=1 Tax=Streptomyces nitrosporeus TaxID=28894 RepID=UPI0039A2FEB9